MFRKKDTGESKQLLEGIELTTLVHGEKTLMGQFKIARGSAIPPHSHPHEQVAYVAEGEVIFLMDGEETHLRPGDMYLVPSGKPHSIQQLTEHVRLVDCFTPIREDFLK